jgi:hypothetical protein
VVVEARDQVVILAIHEEQGIEAADPGEGIRAHHPGGRIDAADRVVRLHPAQAGVRQILRRVALQVAALGLGIERAEVGAAMERRGDRVAGVLVEEAGEQAQRIRRDEGVLVQQEDVVGAVVQRMADASIVATPKTGVALLGDQHRLGILLPDNVGGAVAGGIVDYYRHAWGFAGPQRVKCATYPRRAVVGHKDDINVHMAISLNNSYKKDKPRP